MTKYRAQRCEAHGIKFDSKMECARYLQLMALQDAGQIWGLKPHPKFPLTVMGKKICTYEADSEYFEPMPTGEPIKIVEDVKGFETAAFRIKRKLFEVLYGMPLRIVKKGRR